jgi:hypothetical protein
MLRRRKRFEKPGLWILSSAEKMLCGTSAEFPESLTLSDEKFQVIS